MWETISFSFMFGLISSIGICLASCTPILISYFISTEKDPKKFIGGMFVFLCLRAAVFLAFTLLIVMIGRIAFDFVKEYALVLRIIGGSIVSIAGIMIFLDIGSRMKFFKAKSKGVALLAFLFGIKPCIPHIAIWGYLLTVVSAPMIEGTLSLNNAILSTLMVIAAFTVGENIVPIVFALLGSKTVKYLRGNIFKAITKTCGVLLFILGIAFIFYDRFAPILARFLS